MQEEVRAIAELLLADTYAEITRGIVQLEAFLTTLLPSAKKYHQGTIDTRLATFISLQDKFQLNLASAVLLAYQFFWAHPESVRGEDLALANHLLSGLLLLHSDSRTLFSHRRNLTLVLRFLDKDSLLYSTQTSVSAVSLLVHILLKNTRNMRAFEACNGCQIVIRNLNAGSAKCSAEEEQLHFKIIEFLIFYLSDESGLLHLLENVGVPTLTVRQKAEFLRPEFLGIDELIDNINDLTSLNSPRKP